MLALPSLPPAASAESSPQPLLGVTRSLTGRVWLPRLAHGRDALAIAEKHDLPEILGRVLAGRGVAVDEVEAHLTPTIRMLMPQPQVLNDMEKGAARLADLCCRVAERSVRHNPHGSFQGDAFAHI